MRDCHRVVHSAGLCHTHVRTRPERRRIEALPGPTILPRHPKRVRDALHALAESRPTPAEYERRKAQILTSH